MKKFFVALALILGCSAAHAQFGTQLSPAGCYGTTSATAAACVKRDGNANAFSNNSLQNATLTTAAAGTTVLTAASSRYQALTGSTTQTYQLPDATTLSLGPWFAFNNNSSGTLSIVNAGSGAVATVPAGGVTQCGPTSISTANGTWDCHAYVPSTASWGTGTTGLQMNNVLSTSPQIGAGAASSTSPVFIPQRGSATTGFSGDSTHTYSVVAGATASTTDATGINIPSGHTYQINGSQIDASNLSNGITGSGAVVLATQPTLTAVLLTPVLFIDLPTCNSGNKGLRAIISDNNNAGSGWTALAAGSGSVLTPVYCDGTNWRNG